MVRVSDDYCPNSQSHSLLLSLSLSFSLSFSLQGRGVSSSMNGDALSDESGIRFERTNVTDRCASLHREKERERDRDRERERETSRSHSSTIGSD